MEIEDLLREQKNNDLLVTSVTDYVIAINRNYQIIMANDLFKNEFSTYPEDFCFRSWKNRDDRCENCLVEKSFQDGRVHWNEETVVMKDGRSARMLVKSKPVMNEKGEIVCVLETATDITEKKRLLEELEKISGDLEATIAERLNGLQKSEERYRTIFERSRDAIMLTDPVGIILEVNQAGVEMLGYKTQKELLSLDSIVKLFEKRADLYRFQERISRDGFVTDFETRLFGKKGRTFDALLTSNVILDVIGQITGYVVIIRDITKRKKAQQQIERRNRRLATLNAISMTVSSTLNLTEVINSTIDKMLEILEPDSVRIYLFDTKKQTLNLVAHKGLSANFIGKENMKRRKSGDGLLGQTVVTCKTKVVDNFKRSEDPYVESIIEEGLQSTAYIPLVSQGEPLGAMAVSSHSAFNFSEYHVEFLTAIGNQIGVAVENANLYESINRAYQELKEVQEQVIRTEKLASLGKLSATIAHEINNPLAAVLNYIRLMIKLMDRNRFTTDRLGDISRYLGTMETETARCGEIVKNLLAFSRQAKITIETHSIEKIIERTHPLISHDLKMKEIRLIKDMEADLPDVLCDFKQIQQVLLNLLSNASESMWQGGTLTLTARRFHKSGFLEVLVSDTGCGIPEKEIENIFEPFFTTKEEGKGVGLGLSVAYGIMTRHNGSIEVESELGKGSTFKVMLPVA